MVVESETSLGLHPTQLVTCSIHQRKVNCALVSMTYSTSCQSIDMVKVMLLEHMSVTGEVRAVMSVLSCSVTPSCCISGGSAIFIEL